MKCHSLLHKPPLEPFGYLLATSLTVQSQATPMPLTILKTVPVKYWYTNHRHESHPKLPFVLPTQTDEQIDVSIAPHPSILGLLFPPHKDLTGSVFVQYAIHLPPLAPASHHHHRPVVLVGIADNLPSTQPQNGLTSD